MQGYRYGANRPELGLSIFDSMELFGQQTPDYMRSVASRIVSSVLLQQHDVTPMSKRLKILSSMSEGQRVC